ncbi:hypothetical protein CYMTET_14325 [Cymbomonas tetramitiformis]|uniref:Uncharacterized protein n=1 Tax=Cymbomonas tetramitiformis TaxID=36881 RepID=A0AAE0LAH3_9CHLO|nr:hypothetical protein CYMTET_14325 [Cymbomonas tetramitiformis]
MLKRLSKGKRAFREKRPSASEDPKWLAQKASLLTGPWVEPGLEFHSGSFLIGQTVYVFGYGEGRVLHFRKNSMSASPHIIRFQDASHHVKLERKGNGETPWLISMTAYKCSEKASPLTPSSRERLSSRSFESLSSFGRRALQFSPVSEPEPEPSPSRSDAQLQGPASKSRPLSESQLSGRERTLSMLRSKHFLSITPLCPEPLPYGKTYRRSSSEPIVRRLPESSTAFPKSLIEETPTTVAAAVPPNRRPRTVTAPAAIPIPSTQSASDQAAEGEEHARTRGVEAQVPACNTPTTPASTATRGKLSHLFDCYIVIGASEDVQQRLSKTMQKWTWARNAKQAAELEALTEDLAAELLCIYPPSDDPSRSDAFRQFCFPEPYKLELHHGFLPPLPKDDHFVFCMTEGMAAPVPLYGACIRTQEVLASSFTRTSAAKPGAKQQVHVIAPRCYCLFSRSPMFEALFCVLHSLMLQERLDRVNQIPLSVLVPEGFDERAGNKVQVAHGTSAQSCIFEVSVPKGLARKDVFTIAVPTPWRDRNQVVSTLLLTSSARHPHSHHPSHTTSV